MFIQNLVVTASLSFSLVEHDDLKKLVTSEYNFCHVLSSKTLMKNVTSQHEKLIKTMKERFSKVEFLVTTAHCWSIVKKYPIRINKYKCMY